MKITPCIIGLGYVGLPIALALDTGSEKKAREINMACEMYYEYLYKDEYHATVQKLFIESLDNRLLEHKKKVIWLHCDENSLSTTPSGEPLYPLT